MPTEKQILNEIRKLVPKSEEFLRDDAAIIEKNLIVTTDSLIENTHFTKDAYSPDEIGWKALAVSLSDIAAMGGKPLYALVSLSLPKTITLNWIQNLYIGLRSCAKKYKTKIIGGNLTRSNEINITVTIIGKTKAGPPPAKKPSSAVGKRSNAKPGDLVFASGTFGDSALGFYLLKERNKYPLPTKITNELIQKHKEPKCQIKLGQKIIRLCKRVALMDASDGLADCLIQIAEESKVKITIEKNKIPISHHSKEITKLLKKDP